MREHSIKIEKLTPAERAKYDIYRTVRFKNEKGSDNTAEKPNEANGQDPSAANKKPASSLKRKITRSQTVNAFNSKSLETHLRLNKSLNKLHGDISISKGRTMTAA